MHTSQIIQQLEDEIYADRKKLNNLIQLTAILQPTRQQQQQQQQPLTSLNDKIAVIHALFRVYSSLMHQIKVSDSDPSSSDKKKQVLREWLKGNYNAFTGHLLQILLSSSSSSSTSDNNQDQSQRRLMITALKALMDLVIKESHAVNMFSPDLFAQVVQTCLMSEGNPALASSFNQFYIQKYDDVRYFFMRDAVNVIARVNRHSSGKRLRDEDSEKVLIVLRDNLFSIMPSLSALCPNTQEDINVLLCPESMNIDKFKSLHSHKRRFSDMWLAFLRLPLTEPIYKKVLHDLNEHIIPHMVDPRMLHDFLTDSYNHHGATTSLLALSSLFTLITKHNLDYPHFYTKLYALFDGNMLHTKHRSKFLKLANTFLKSTHLPSYLVAAFLKRMARLCLFATPAGILSVLPIMHNLLHRNLSCMPLLHRVPESEENTTVTNEMMAQDPYNFSERDPAKCNALQSSLWELEVLRDHYSGAVSNFVKRFQKIIDVKQPLIDIDGYLDNTDTAMVDSEMARVARKPAAMVTSKVVLFGETSLVTKIWTQ